MKNMKLIMENFRKTMKEAWPGTEEPKASWSGKPQKNWSKEIGVHNAANAARKEAMRLAVADIERQYDERELHNMVYDELEDLFVNSFSDNHPKQDIPDEDEVESMMKALELFNPIEKDDPMPSDQQDNPGFAKGEGGNY